MTPTDRRLIRRGVAAGALVLATVGFAACGGSSSGDAATTAPAASATTTAPKGTANKATANELDVKLVDYGFESPDSVAAGYVRLNVTDTGKEQHEVQVARLNDGVTWAQVDERLHSSTPDVVAAMVTMVGGAAPVEPEGAASTTVKLEEGSYGLFCFIVGWDGTSHLAHGMAKPLEVTAAKAETSEPESNGTIVLKDMSIELPKGFDGKGTWKVVNEGPQAHEAMILQYAEGATDADVKAYLSATSPPAAPPALAVGGAAAIAKGQEEWIDLDLPKGKSLWMCVIPDLTKGGIPHFMEGMQTVVTT